MARGEEWTAEDEAASREFIKRTLATSHGTGGIITAKDLLAKDLPPMEYILDPWFPTAGAVMTHAYSGVGKTHFAMSDTLAITSGTGFLKWTAPRARRALYVDGEMDRRELQQEIRLLVRGQPEWERGLDNLHIITPDEMPGGVIPDLNTPAGRRWLDRMIEAADAEVLVLDSIRTLFYGLKENDNEAWAGLNEMVKGLRRDGIAPHLVHHDNKNNGYSGGTNQLTLIGAERALTNLNTAEDDSGIRVKVLFGKHRGFYGPDCWPFEARLVTDDKINGKAVWQYDSERVVVLARGVDRAKHEEDLQRALAMHRDGKSYREVGAALKCGKDKAGDLVKEALAREAAAQPQPQLERQAA